MKNTTLVGNQLETRVSNILKMLLGSDDFFVTGNKSRIFRQQGYYSNTRKKTS